MGTNFYIVTSNNESDDPENQVRTISHIAKRSAAGDFCWDCGVTLCKGGIEKVHHGQYEWYDACPKCGKSPAREDLKYSSAGRELGFNKSPPKKKSGVASCSSFTWAIDPKDLDKLLIPQKEDFLPIERLFTNYNPRRIEDEYGRSFTRKEFDEVLEECPIQYFDMMGREFS